jgi:hypothetical protein
MRGGSIFRYVECQQWHMVAPGWSQLKQPSQPGRDRGFFTWKFPSRIQSPKLSWASAIRDEIQTRGFFLLFDDRLKVFGTDGDMRETLEKFAESHGWRAELNAGHDAAVFTNASHDKDEHH